MNAFEAPAWSEMFSPGLSLAESFLRGSIIYLALVILFRVILKRQTGSLGLPDVMLVVLVSECVSEALSANSKSILNGLVTVAALLFWSYALDRLAHRWPWLQRQLEPRPLVLVKDGKLIRKNLKAEGITEDELAGQLRLNGIDHVSKVKLACIESEGALSVVPKEEPAPAPSNASMDEPTTGQETPDIERITDQFLSIAAELQKAATWHEERVTEHQTAARAARQLLTRHGVRMRRALNPTSSSDSGKQHRADTKGGESPTSAPRTTEAQT